MYCIFSNGWSKSRDANEEDWHSDWQGGDLAASAKAYVEMAFDQEQVAPDPSYLEVDVREGSVFEHNDPSGVTWVLVSTDSPHYHKFA